VAAAYPTLTGYVNDFAGLLTPQERASLAAQAGLVEKNTTVQIAIVTVLTTNGEDPILYGAHTGTQNGVGQKATDNGVVIVYSVADGGGIATGRGIESTLTDYWVINVGRNAHMYFAIGKYYDGFSYLISEIDKRVEPKNLSAPATEAPANPPPSGAFLFVILIGGIIVMLIVILVSRSIGSAISGSEREEHDDDEHLRTAAVAAALGSIILDRHYQHDDDDDSFNSDFHSTRSGGHGGGFGGFGGGSFGGGGGHF
jgi:uncharacterized protein